MSTLRTNQLKGRDSNQISLAANQELRVEGTFDAKTSLLMPSWDIANRPASPIVGSLGYNTELASPEIFAGTDSEGEIIGDAGWQAIGEPNFPDLGDVIDGPAPFLHYEHDDLADIADGSTNNSTNRWINKGSGGPPYDLIGDNGSGGVGSPSIQTVSGFKCLRFNGFQSTGFASAPYITAYSSSSIHNWTVCYVYGNGSSSGGTNSSPTFCGHAYGGNTSSLDRVGGGIFGWNFGQIYKWHVNDGGFNQFNVNGNGYNNSTFTQWIQTNQSNSWQIYKDRTSGAIASGNDSAYGADIWITGIGNGRRQDSSSYTTTGDVVFAAYWSTALTATQLTNLRNYLGEKYNGLGTTNS